MEGDDVAANLNPSDLDDVVGHYGRASADQAKDAIAAARAAFPAWSRSLPEQRLEALDKIGREILDRKEELGTLLSREEGKTLPEGIGEAGRAGQIFRFFAQEALRGTGDVVDSVRPGISVEMRREPMGVVGIITPWNFPIAIPAWKIAPALAYGNCVVMKPADLVPGSAWALAEIIGRSGLPEGVFNLVMGRGSVVGETILTSPDIDAITFTGSVETGGHVAKTAVARMAKFQLEMGGKNPLLVLDDADLDTAVSCAVNGAFFSTGQRCTASSRLIVTEKHPRPPSSRKCLTAANGGPEGRSTPCDQAGAPRSARWSTRSQFETRTSPTWTLAGQGGLRGWPAAASAWSARRRGFYQAPAVFLGRRTTACGSAARRSSGRCASIIKVARTSTKALAVANDTEFGLSSGHLHDLA